MTDRRRDSFTDPTPWLLEPDTDNPAVRYFALTQLLDLPEDDPDVVEARRNIMTSGPVPAILDAQDPEGYWAKPGTGYSPKYQGTVWQIIFLSELGADPADERVQRGVEYLLSHAIADSGAFAASQPPRPSSAVHCLNGNLLHALIRLGYAADPRVQAALEWQARAVTGDGEITYYKSGTSGAGFVCSINQGQPCGWGATKALRALASVPPELRTPVIERALATGAKFLFSHDPANADYPFTDHVSNTWFRFGFPLSYWSDVLETTEALIDLGYGRDVRLAHALLLILDKQDTQGRWKLEQSLNGKMWADIEAKGKPSKWVTLRAMRVLLRSEYF